MPALLPFTPMQAANPWTDLPSEPPFVAAADHPLLDSSYIKRAQLRLNHLPVPYLGDPRQARIILLGLNPGWSPSTDAFETSPEYQSRNRDCLLFTARHPFFSLDPQLSDTPGYKWWYARLRLLIEEFGLEIVTHRLACVEWFPYHSATFTRPPKLLPSQRFGFALVADAIERGAVIVIMRSSQFWLKSVPLLASAPCVSVRNVRSPYITPRNLNPGGFEQVLTAMG